ncbi:hypothetical protein CR513_59695, partial [Mucuna pruriens]
MLKRGGSLIQVATITEQVERTVKLGNNYVLKVDGKGIVELLINEIMHLVNNVFYVLELKNNLFNMGQFFEKGLSIEMNGLKTLLEHDMVKGLPTFKSPTQLYKHCLKVKHITNLVNHSSNENKRYILTFIDYLSRKLKNKLVCLYLNFCTLEEAWTRMNPFVSCFRIFGCNGFVHIRDKKKSKLDDKSINDWGEAKTNKTLDANELNPMEESCQADQEKIQTSLNDASTT